MIIISRTKDEGIVIGDDIIINVAEIRGDSVRLGIECPKEMSFRKGEVIEALQQEVQEVKRSA